MLMYLRAHLFAFICNYLFASQTTQENHSLFIVVLLEVYLVTVACFDTTISETENVIEVWCPVARFVRKLALHAQLL